MSAHSSAHSFPLEPHLYIMRPLWAEFAFYHVPADIHRNLKDHDPRVIAMKKLLILALTAASATFTFAADDATVAKYNQSCGICHGSGAAGAPKTGSTEDWAPRLEKGMDALVASVVNGLNAMPPKGMCNDCTADDYRALIIYMSGAK